MVYHGELSVMKWHCHEMRKNKVQKNGFQSLENMQCKHIEETCSINKPIWYKVYNYCVEYVIKYFNTGNPRDNIHIDILLTSSTQETYLRFVFEYLKQMLLNLKKILNICLLCIFMKISYIKLHHKLTTHSDVMVIYQMNCKIFGKSTLYINTNKNNLFCLYNWLTNST